MTLGGRTSGSVSKVMGGGGGVVVVVVVLSIIVSPPAQSIPSTTVNSIKIKKN